MKSGFYEEKVIFEFENVFGMLKKPCFPPFVALDV